MDIGQTVHKPNKTLKLNLKCMFLNWKYTEEYKVEFLLTGLFFLSIFALCG